MSEAEAVPQTKKRRHRKQQAVATGEAIVAGVNALGHDDLLHFVELLADDTLCALVQMTTARFASRRAVVAKQWALPLEAGGE